MSNVHGSNVFIVKGFTLLTYYSEVSLKTFLAGCQLVFNQFTQCPALNKTLDYKTMMQVEVKPYSTFVFVAKQRNLEGRVRKPMETERHQTVKNPVEAAPQHKAQSRPPHQVPLRITKLSHSHPQRLQVTQCVGGVGR